MRVMKVLILVVLAFLLVAVAIALGSDTGAVEKLVLVAIAALLVYAGSKVWQIGTRQAV